MQEKILDNKRLQYIDIAKGIAMICIILGHMGNANINRVVFTFHVPIFFFITGYFISDKCEVNIFVRNKVRTLIIPYLITCFAIVIIATLQGAICGDAIVEIKNGVMLRYMVQVIHILIRFIFRESEQYGFCWRRSGEVFF